MKTFLIHDPLRTDREILYKKELMEQGLMNMLEQTEVEIIPAVKEYGNVWKNISEAHKNCIREAVKDDLPEVMILEDDVKFSAPGAYNEFIRLSGELSEDWDLFTGGSYDYMIEHNGNGSHHMREPFTKLRRFSGLHCYIVRKRFYQHFLETRGVTNLDKALVGNIWMAWPQLGLQHTTYSDNVKKKIDYNTVFAKKIKIWDGERK